MLSPRNPLLLFQIVTPTSPRGQGGTLVPGFDAESAELVKFDKFEYTDTWAALDMMTLTFEDKNYWLQDHPLIREMESKCLFKFGYADALSPMHEMTLFRVEPTFPEDGKVMVTLRFFSAGVNIGGPRRNATFINQASRGSTMLASEVAERIAIANGFTPVITPCHATPTSARVEWKQLNKSDIEFLREIAVGLRAADGREGKYYVQVRNNELHFGPMPVEDSNAFVFTYKGANSPLRSFAPALPADMMRGMGNITGYDGIDPASGQRVSGSKDHNTDTDRPTLDRYVIDHNRGTSTLTPNSKPAPKGLMYRNPEYDRRRSDLEAQRDALWRGIQTTERAMRKLGKTQKEIDVALATDRATYKTLGQQIAAVNMRDASAFETKSPFEIPSDAANEDLFRTTLFNMMTASAELWGMPLLIAGIPITIDGVSKRFGKTWWVREVRHTYTVTTGMTTSLDMQKNALGIGDPSSGNAVRKPAAVEVVFVHDYATGKQGWEARPAQGYFDAVASQSGGEPPKEPPTKAPPTLIEITDPRNPNDVFRSTSIGLPKANVPKYKEEKK